MANQITVQVYAIDNIPQRSALNVSFPTNQISAQLATSVLATNIQSQINYYPNPNNQAQLTEVLVSQSIGAIATLAGNSMFAASIYKINGYPQGGQALSMLFPSVQPSIWNVNGGGDVHSFVQFKGKKYYAHETGASLATAANATDSSGGGVTDITYAALVTAINASGLTAGAQYKITDYATKHYIVDASGTQYLGSIITGVNEPLIVTASSSNTLEPVAYSALHPEDIIYYDFNPANWLDDLSFADLSGTPAIVTGFKGVIYFRHDTLLDNYMGYDFRNCKFRRWKTNVSAYDSGTTYAQGDYVNSAGFIYEALKGANTNHTPANPSVWWVQLIDLSTTEYWCNNSVSINGITADAAAFDDFKTFSEGAGRATYNAGVRSNHFKSFKDEYSDDEISGTILMNNVFFLQNVSYYLVYANNFFAESFGNTIVGAGFFSNSINGADFQRNLIGANFVDNTITTGFGNNIIGSGFNDNSVRNFLENSVGESFGSNTIATGFYSNLIGANFSNNNVGSVFQNNKAGANFQHNTIQDSISGIDYTSATHVYAAYSKTIFKRVDGTAKLSYCDNSDVIQIVNANA